jgi:broad specificity phosphatase PhoE
MTSTTLGLVRHGQTDWNLALLLQGSTDVPLNETGRLQAKQAASKINADNWDVLLCSPLDRARETADAFGLVLGLQPIVVEGLIERSFGSAEGLSIAEWRTLHDKHDEIEGIETLAQLKSRATALLELIATEYAGLRVLAISHGALIRKLITIVSDGEYPLENDRLQNVSLNRLEHADGVWTLSEYAPQSLADI